MVARNDLSKQYDSLLESSGPLAKLTGRPQQSYIFPDDLGNLDHWVAFTVIHHKQARKKTRNTVKPLKTIFLPIPSNLQTQYNAQYDNDALGPFGAIGRDIASQIDFSGSARSIADQTLRGIRGVSGDRWLGALSSVGLRGVELNAGAVASAAIADRSKGGPLTTGLAGGVGLAIEQGIKGALFGQGIARNPHMAVLFKGMDFRTHSFQYKFVPKTRQESQMLTDLIYQFKYHMTPEYRLAENLFSYPEVFDIDFHHSKHLFNISPSVLTSFEVNYHGEGIPAYHSNNVEQDFSNASDFEVTPETSKQDIAPVSVTISMVFQETEINTKQTIQHEKR